MINLKRVFEMEGKWRSKAVSRGRRRQISMPSNAASSSSSSGDDHLVAQKGHFVVYSIDKKRFEVPLRYLNHEIFKELLTMSQEEFGLAATGPIMLPCDAVFVELAKSSLDQQKLSSHKYFCGASLLSMVANKCSIISSFNRQDNDHQSSQQHQMLLVPGF